MILRNCKLEYDVDSDACIDLKNWFLREAPIKDNLIKCNKYCRKFHDFCILILMTMK